MADMAAAVPVTRGTVGCLCVRQPTASLGRSLLSSVSRWPAALSEYQRVGRGSARLLHGLDGIRPGFHSRTRGSSLHQFLPRTSGLVSYRVLADRLLRWRRPIDFNQKERVLCRLTCRVCTVIWRPGACWPLRFRRFPAETFRKSRVRPPTAQRPSSLPFSPFHPTRWRT